MKHIRVIARGSRLSRLQVEEVMGNIPGVSYSVRYIDTLGDLRRDISLIDGAAPDDFFTREIDEALLAGEADVAVHSAKDLPYPLPDGITVIALTKAADTTDSLVSRGHLPLSALRAGSVIGTSSPLRKRALLEARPDLVVRGIRGNVEERVALVASGDYDAAIVATCALKRLGMESEISEILPFATHPLQGFLAVTAADSTLKTLFESVDTLRGQGAVTLIGFGPGDPELLTVKAVKALSRADIIFHDDLIDLSALDGVTAEKRYVGKRAGSHHAEQDAINRMMLDAARGGKRVARLKGGDPSLFAHTGEEVEYLRSNMVEVSIIPGVTAAAALSADGLITMTHRAIASSVALLSGHGETPDADADTLVYYMAAARLKTIARRLIARGRPADTPVLLGYNVSRDDERLIDTTLASLSDGGGEIFPTPLIALVGDVAGLRRHKAFDMRRTLNTGLNPVDGAINIPLIEIHPVADTAPLKKAAERVYDYLLFTSRHGVRYFLDAVEGTVHARHIVSIGPSTTKALKERGVENIEQVGKDNSYGVIEFFSERERGSVLLPRSSKALGIIPDALRRLGYDMICLTAYINMMPERPRKVNLRHINRVIFTSPSTIDNFILLYGGLPKGIAYETRGAVTEEYLHNRQK